MNKVMDDFVWLLGEALIIGMILRTLDLDQHLVVFIIALCLAIPIACRMLRFCALRLLTKEQVANDTDL